MPLRGPARRARRRRRSGWRASIRSFAPSPRPRPRRRAVRAPRSPWPGRDWRAVPVGEPGAEHGAARGRQPRAQQEVVGAPGPGEDVVLLPSLRRPGGERALRGQRVGARPGRDRPEDDRDAHADEEDRRRQAPRGRARPIRARFGGHGAEGDAVGGAGHAHDALLRGSARDGAQPASLDPVGAGQHVGDARAGGARGGAVVVDRLAVERERARRPVAAELEAGQAWSPPRRARPAPRRPRRRGRWPSRRCRPRAGDRRRASPRPSRWTGPPRSGSADPPPGRRARPRRTRRDRSGPRLRRTRRPRAVDRPAADRGARRASTPVTASTRTSAGIGPEASTHGPLLPAYAILALTLRPGVPSPPVDRGRRRRPSPGTGAGWPC